MMSFAKCALIVATCLVAAAGSQSIRTKPRTALPHDVPVVAHLATPAAFPPARAGHNQPDDTAMRAPNPWLMLAVGAGLSALQLRRRQKGAAGTRVDPPLIDHLPHGARLSRE